MDKRRKIADVTRVVLSPDSAAVLGFVLLAWGLSEYSAAVAASVGGGLLLAAGVVGHLRKKPPKRPR